MRKLLVSSAAALTLLAFGSVNQAQALDCGTSTAALIAPASVVGGFAATGDMSIAVGGGATAIATAPLTGMAALLVAGLYINYECTGSMFKQARPSEFVTVEPRVPTTDIAARQYVDGSYKSRLGL